MRPDAMASRFKALSKPGGYLGGAAPMQQAPAGIQAMAQPAPPPPGMMPPVSAPVAQAAPIGTPPVQNGYVPDLGLQAMPPSAVPALEDGIEVRGGGGPDGIQSIGKGAGGGGVDFGIHPGGGPQGGPDEGGPPASASIYDIPASEVRGRGGAFARRWRQFQASRGNRGHRNHMGAVGGVDRRNRMRRPSNQWRNRDQTGVQVGPNDPPPPGGGS